MIILHASTVYLPDNSPPVVSDRGGLAESCNGAGFVLPLPPAQTTATRRPVESSAVEPWMEVIAKLAFNDPFIRTP